MWQNTKSLVVVSFLIIFSGLGFLWFGLKPASNSLPTPTPLPSLETTPIARLSASSPANANEALRAGEVADNGGQATSSARPLTPASPLAEQSEAAGERSDGERATQGLMGERALVTDVVDGDTIKVSLQGKQQTVRFVGMDTPETVDPRRPVGCFGKEASNETKSLLTGKEIIMQKDVSNTDKYDRLLRYIFLPLDNGQILFVNDYLVREGFAKVYTYPPDVKFNEQFLQAEREAKEFRRGLWGRC